MWSTLKGLFMCIFDVVRVKRLFTLVLIPFFSGPFLLTLTIVSVDRPDKPVTTRLSYHYHVAASSTVLSRTFIVA